MRSLSLKNNILHAIEHRALLRLVITLNVSWTFKGHMLNSIVTTGAIVDYPSEAIVQYKHTYYSMLLTSSIPSLS